MHFEFIRGGQTPQPKSANLSAPARDRLVPVRDLANLFGCTEPEIVKWADCMSLVQENLDWRGSELSCLTLQDAFRLHLAMRAMAEDPIQAADLRTLELRRTLERKEQDLEQTRTELRALGTSIEQRNNELQTLMTGVGQLEQAVAERAGVHRELEGVKKLYVESQAQQSELVFKWSGAQEALREQQEGQSAAREKLQELEQHLAGVQAAKQQGEQEAMHAQNQAKESEARLIQELSSAEERIKHAETVARDAQPDPNEVEHQRLTRVRTSERLRSLRRTCLTANEVEQNLERYCNRLEKKLRG